MTQRILNFHMIILLSLFVLGGLSPLWISLYIRLNYLEIYDKLSDFVLPAVLIVGVVITTIILSALIKKEWVKPLTLFAAGLACVIPIFFYVYFIVTVESLPL